MHKPSCAAGRGAKVQGGFFCGISLIRPLALSKLGFAAVQLVPLNAKHQRATCQVALGLSGTRRVVVGVLALAMDECPVQAAQMPLPWLHAAHGQVHRRRAAASSRSCGGCVGHIPGPLCCWCSVWAIVCAPVGGVSGAGGIPAGVCFALALRRRPGACRRGLRMGWAAWRWVYLPAFNLHVDFAVGKGHRHGPPAAALVAKHRAGLAT